MTSSAPCIEKLKANFLLNLEHIEANVGIPRLIFSDQIHLDNEILRERMLNNINNHMTRLAEMIKQCQKDGTIRKDVDPTGSALMLLGMIQTLAMKWSLTGCSFKLREAGLELWNNYERCVNEN